MTLALLAGFGAMPTGEAKAQSYTAVIRNGSTNYVLDDPGWSETAGTDIQTWRANDGLNQTWVLTRVGTDQDGDYYKITNACSGLVLDDWAWSMVPGTYVQQWYDIGGDNQLWYVHPVNYWDYNLNLYWITNRYNGMALTGPRYGSTLVQQYPLNTSSTNQQWALIMQ
jgi:hypothetical protein